jgi:hypothetical protein
VAETHLSRDDMPIRDYGVDQYDEACEYRYDALNRRFGT